MVGVSRSYQLCAVTEIDGAARANARLTAMPIAPNCTTTDKSAERPPLG